MENGRKSSFLFQRYDKVMFKSIKFNLFVIIVKWVEEVVVMHTKSILSINQRLYEQIIKCLPLMYFHFMTKEIFNHPDVPQFIWQFWKLSPMKFCYM